MIEQIGEHDGWRMVRNEFATGRPLIEIYAPHGGFLAIPAEVINELWMQKTFRELEAMADRMGIVLPARLTDDESKTPGGPPPPLPTRDPQPRPVMGAGSNESSKTAEG